MSQKRRFFSYSKQRCRLDLDPEHLMIEAKNGNSRAFDVLYRLYLTPVFRYLYARTWNHEIAEDISQTAFVKAYCGLSGWRNLGKDPLAYFYTIARNALADYWHGEQHIAALNTECDQIADTQISPEIMLIHSQPGEILKRALDNLTKDQREVLIMRYFDGLNYAEISKTTGKSKDSIRQHHSRALKALRRIIKGRSAASNKLTIQNCVSSKRRSDVLMNSKTILCRTPPPCTYLKRAYQVPRNLNRVSDVLTQTTLKVSDVLKVVN